MNRVKSRKKRYQIPPFNTDQVCLYSYVYLGVLRTLGGFFRFLKYLHKFETEPQPELSSFHIHALHYLHRVYTNLQRATGIYR